MERFAHIVGKYWDTITYVDCFSGPWNERSDNLEDSSFAIALEELRKARQTLAAAGKSLRIRCCFLDKDVSAFDKLEAYSEGVSDAEIRLLNATFEDSIPDILDFVKGGGGQCFPFFFIDPKGWTGFGMKTIAPLLSHQPGEVLINLMGHLHRFLDAPNTRKSVEDLFGSLEILSEIQGLTGLERQDAVAEAYARNVKLTGNFKHTGIALVLHPEKDKTHYHLVYATRKPKGLEVFKEAERKGMAIQVQARSSSILRRKEEKKRQQDLFGMAFPPDSGYAESLRARYTGKSKAIVNKILKSKKQLPYEEAWQIALSKPMTQEKDLHEWIADWKNAGNLDIEGMKQRQRVPKRGDGIILHWQ